MTLYEKKANYWYHNANPGFFEELSIPVDGRVSGHLSLLLLLVLIVGPFDGFVGDEGGELCSD